MYCSLTKTWNTCTSHSPRLGIHVLLTHQDLEYMYFSLTKTWNTGGHQIIGRTQLSDVALFLALQTQICEICLQCRLLRDKLRTHRKNYQITTNNKHFTVENVRPPYPPTICTCGGSDVLPNQTLFFKKISMYSSSVIFTGYFDLKNTSF